MDERICARYWIETAFPVDEVAQTIAREQSAHVESIRELDAVTAPSLPDADLPAGLTGLPVYRRAELELSWPLANLGPSLPNLLAAVAGNLFELTHCSGLRLLDLTLPPAFAERYGGPQFGVAGTRKLADVHGRPVIGAAIEPGAGLTPEAAADTVRRLVERGIDFIRDSELLADGPHCPFDERLDAVMRVVNEAAERSGRKVMYAPNITGEIREMWRRHDRVVAAGGTCVMVSLNGIGLPGLAALRRHAAVAIHGHRNGWGLLRRSPAIGMSFLAWQKLWRVAGIDHLHVDGIASAAECLRPMFPAPTAGCEIMPAFPAGQPYGGLGSADLICEEVSFGKR